MESLEGFNLELKRAEEYLDAMAKGTANKEDCENVKMHLDNINSIVRNLSIPDVVGSFWSDDAITRLKAEYFEKGLKGK